MYTMMLIAVLVTAQPFGDNELKLDNVYVNDGVMEKNYKTKDECERHVKNFRKKDRLYHTEVTKTKENFYYMVKIAYCKKIN